MSPQRRFPPFAETLSIPLGQWRKMCHNLAARDGIVGIPGFSARYEAMIARKPSGKSITIGRLYVDGTDPRVDRVTGRCDQRGRVSDGAPQRTTPKQSWKKIRDRFRRTALPESAFKEQWDKAQTDGSTVAIADGWLSDRKYLGKAGVSPGHPSRPLAGRTTIQYTDTRVR